MGENLQFIYKEEYWFISAFLNTSKINGEQKASEIEKLINDSLKQLTDDDIYRKDLKDEILDIVKNIELKCIWFPYVENFPYRDENSDREYNTLGYFQFKVEHYKNNPSKKEIITPMLIQQIPHIVLSILTKFSKNIENIGLELDTESPIYVFATSNNSKPADIKWTKENIEKYKKVIAYWTVIYSGQWEDYSDALYDKRIQNNLSNRLSELHFIYKNSAFIYMAEENYEKHFESYMKKSVLEPISKMRAVLFALRTINESLDLLFLKTHSGTFANLEIIENKIRNLRLLRGLISTRLNLIYNELDFNRRQHYTSVLKHLIELFELDDIVNRVNERFKIIYEAMQELYLKKSKENQERTEKGLSLLNLLFGAGVLADLAGVIMIALTLQESSTLSVLLNGIIGLFMIGILIATVGYYLFLRIKIKSTEISQTVDAIIEDGKGNIVLIKRKYPPFRNFYALPGGFIEKGEKPKQALIRETKEETNLDVIIVRKVGYYSEEGRDPRGLIHSTAYKCRVIKDTVNMRSGDDSKDVELISIDKISQLELAFDHRKILTDAGIIK